MGKACSLHRAPSDSAALTDLVARSNRAPAASPLSRSIVSGDHNAPFSALCDVWGPRWMADSDSLLHCVVMG